MHLTIGLAEGETTQQAILRKLQSASPAIPCGAPLMPFANSSNLHVECCNIQMAGVGAKVKGGQVELHGVVLAHQKGPQTLCVAAAKPTTCDLSMHCGSNHLSTAPPCLWTNGANRSKWPVLHKWVHDVLPCMHCFSGHRAATKSPLGAFGTKSPHHMGAPGVLRLHTTRGPLWHC